MRQCNCLLKCRLGGGGSTLDCSKEQFTLFKVIQGVAKLRRQALLTGLVKLVMQMAQHIAPLILPCGLIMTVRDCSFVGTLVRWPNHSYRTVSSIVPSHHDKCRLICVILKCVPYTILVANMSYSVYYYRHAALRHKHISRIIWSFISIIWGQPVTGSVGLVRNINLLDYESFILIPVRCLSHNTFFLAIWQIHLAQLFCCLFRKVYYSAKYFDSSWLIQGFRKMRNWPQSSWVLKYEEFS